MYHAEGRVYNNGGTLRYEYAIRDHLGNARLTFTDKNGNGVVDVTNTSANEILQENHFYPFGLDMAGPWMNDAAQDNLYKYNGKELNGDFGLNWMDYGARWYDASVGRWWCVDQLAEMSFSESGYVYGGCNPVNNMDLGGLFKINPKGTYPMFEQYLKSGDLERLLKNADLRNGLKTLGNFSEEQLNEMSSYDEGPEIYIADGVEMGINEGPAPDGKFRSSDGSGSFFINKQLINQFEQATPENRQSTLLLLIMTVFHESVHVGVNKNRLPKISVNGNWKKKGDVYYFNSKPVGFKEGSDIESYLKNKKYNEHTMTSEDGRTLENIIWFLGIHSKTSEMATEEAKEFIQQTDKSRTIPRA